MDPRLVQVALGNWSGKGLSNLEVDLVKVSGRDSSDDSMRKAFSKAENAMKIDVQADLAHEMPELTASQLDSLVEHGFETKWPDSDMGMSTGSFVIEHDQSKTRYSIVALLMFFAGFGREDFDWEIVHVPSLTGSHNSILGIEIGSGRETA